MSQVADAASAQPRAISWPQPAQPSSSLHAAKIRLRLSPRRSGAQGRGPSLFPCDVANPDQIEEVVEAALTQYDRVDILVNNAGTVWPVEQVYEADPEEWAYNIHCNLVVHFKWPAMSCLS